MSSRRYLSEDFKIDIKATPKKVDIKADGDEAKEVEDLARSMFGDDFDFFSAFDEEEATEEVDEPIDNGFEDEEEVEEEEVTDEDIEELTELFNASLDIDAHDFGGSGNNVSVLGGGIKEECEDKKDLEELFDAKVNLDAHNFGGNNNDVSVLSPGGMISEEANLDEGNIVKQYVHYKWADEKGTGPVDASADTVEGLAKKLGLSVGSVKSCISRGDPKFAKVEYDEDDEFDDIDLDAYEKRQAEKKNLEECGPIEEKCEEKLELREDIGEQFVLRFEEIADDFGRPRYLSDVGYKENGNTVDIFDSYVVDPRQAHKFNTAEEAQAWYDANTPNDETLDLSGFEDGWYKIISTNDAKYKSDVARYNKRDYDKARYANKKTGLIEDTGEQFVLWVEEVADDWGVPRYLSETGYLDVDSYDDFKNWVTDAREAHKFNSVEEAKDWYIKNTPEEYSTRDFTDGFAKVLSTNDPQFKRDVARHNKRDYDKARYAKRKI